MNFTEGKPVNIGKILAPSILSVLWALAAGKRLMRSDSRLKRLLELLDYRARAFDMAGGSLNQFPWLRFIAPEKTGYNLVTKLNSELRNFLMVSEKIGPMHLTIFLKIIICIGNN